MTEELAVLIINMTPVAIVILAAVFVLSPRLGLSIALLIGGWLLVISPLTSWLGAIILVCVIFGCGFVLGRVRL